MTGQLVALVISSPRTAGHSRVTRPSRPSRASRLSRASHLTRLPYMASGNRAGPGRPPSSPALLDQLSISLPWYLSPALGPSPPSRELGHPRGIHRTPMGSGEFSGPGQTPAIRQAPPLHFGGIRPLPNRTTATITSVTAPVVTMGPRDSPAPLWGPGNFQGRGKRQPSGRHHPSTLVELGKFPNRTTATITSVTAPVVTMASYGGVSTSTSLGRPFLSGHSPEQPGLGPMGQPQ